MNAFISTRWENILATHRRFASYFSWLLAPNDCLLTWPNRRLKSLRRTSRTSYFEGACFLPHTLIRKLLIPWALIENMCCTLRSASMSSTAWGLFDRLPWEDTNWTWRGSSSSSSFFPIALRWWTWTFFGEQAKPLFCKDFLSSLKLYFHRVDTEGRVTISYRSEAILSASLLMYFFSLLFSPSWAKLLALIFRYSGDILKRTWSRSASSSDNSCKRTGMSVKEEISPRVSTAVADIASVVVVVEVRFSLCFYRRFLASRTQELLRPHTSIPSR